MPFIVEDTGNGFCKIIETLYNVIPEKYQHLIDEPRKKIIELTQKYTDKALYRRFSKKNIPITSFFNNLEKKHKELIFNYIDKYQKQVLDIATIHNIPIYLKPHLYENIYSDDKIKINTEFAKPVFNFERNREGIQYHLTIKIDNREINLFEKKVFVLVNNPAYLIIDKELIRFSNIDAKKITPFTNKKFIKVPKKLEKQYFSSFIGNIIKNYEVKAEGFNIEIDKKPDKEAIIYVRENTDNTIIFVPKFRYNHKEIPYTLELKKLVFFNEENMSFKIIERDLLWETYLLTLLEEKNLTSKNSYYILRDSEGISNKEKTILWLNENKKDLEKQGFKFVQQLNKDYFTDGIKLNLEVENKIDWFDLYITVEFDGYKIPFIKLQQYILNDIKEFPLPNGKIAIIPEVWFEKYKKILLFGKKEKDAIRLSKGHLFAFNDEEIKHLKLPNALKIKDFIKQSKNIPPLPKKIKASLRKYQLEGYAWLNALREYRFGGCLVDDMGLGKTLQTITIIQKAIEENSVPKNLFETKSPITNLIIVPTSLIHNWEREIKKFVINPKILLYTGNDREKLLKQIHNYNFILTSYGIIRNDIEKLQNIEFHYIVLDESHLIKNPYSKTYNAVIRLKAKHKLVLTGTPIENSLRDLWTQMNFVNPDLLGSLKFFQDYFITPIEKNDDEKIKSELKKIIAPFILRRTKEQVFEDLPPLAQQTIICEMDDEQAIIYEKEKAKIRNKLLEYYNTGQLRRSSVIILQAMSKLRQLANHPGLVYEGEYKSGKFQEVLLRLETLINKKHKVLIFSSYVKILKILKDEFDKKGWKYLILTGETQNRKQIIDKFQNDEEIKLFLISLKVGGIGLNLTAADYVFLIDPWWNPQAEIQAISRAHRMGQTKKVFVQRFISYNTIEEKIQQLQKKKLKISDEFIDSANLFKIIPEEEILELFS